MVHMFVRGVFNDINEKSNTPFSYMLCLFCKKKPKGELNLERALDEDTGPGVFSFIFFSTGPDWEFHPSSVILGVICNRHE